MAATQYSTPPYATPTVPSRPLGVAILAILVGIVGFLWIVSGAVLIAGWAAVHYLGSASSFAGLSGVTLGVVTLVVGLIILGVALGLWHLRMWALALAVIFTLFELVVLGLANQFVSLGFILALIIFVYLLAVRHHFD